MFKKKLGFVFEVCKINYLRKCWEIWGKEKWVEEKLGWRGKIGKILRKRTDSYQN